MATDIKISELNEITVNDDLNHIIVNDRENPGDEGITKKITLSNLLTPNIVKEANIAACSVTGSKIAPLVIDCSKIVNRTLTANQIAECSIDNFVLGSNSVDSRVINNNCHFTVNALTVTKGPINLPDPDGCLAIESGVTKLNTIRYYWPSSQTAGNFLKTDGSGGLSWSQAVPGESTSLVFSEIMPVGTIVPWAGIGDVPDDKWLECNGGTFDGTVYPDLSAAIGESWGSRSGTDNKLFRRPNLNGRTVVGKGEGTDINGCQQNFSAFSIGGEYKHQITCAEMPSHCHRATGYNLDGGNVGHGNTGHYLPWYNWGGPHNYVNFDSTYPTGSDTPHNNVQPYAVTRYIIKARKDDVEQFNPTLGQGLSATDAGGQTSTITLTSTEIGLKVVPEDFKFDNSGKLELVDKGYRKGEVIEKFFELVPYNILTTDNESKTITLHGGSNFTLNTIPKSVVDVKGIGLTTSYQDIDASKVNYMCPVGAKTVIYSFHFHCGRGTTYPLLHTRLRLGPSTPGGSTALIDEEVVAGYHSHYHMGTDLTTIDFPFEIVQTAQEENIGRGKIFKDNWEGIAREIRLEVREYNSTHQGAIFRITHVDGSSPKRFASPLVGIETIAR